jgi:hypothetical protein
VTGDPSPATGGDATAADNPLAEYFSGHQGRLISKWRHYFEIYHRHFEKFRGRSPVVVEIGVFGGGSLQMWRHYFGPGTRIVGIDVDPRCKRFEDESTTIMIGDQSDRAFLAEVCKAVPHVDILIDDGGHTMAQQIATLEELYLHIQPHGVYLCEDVHTSYMSEFGGGYQRSGSFVEYSKGLIDYLYGWYSQERERLAVNKFTVSTFALHFYDSVLVLEKRPIEPPEAVFAGDSSPDFVASGRR